MDDSLKIIYDSNFWENAWHEAGMLRQEKYGKENACKEEETWDRRADHFDRNVSSDQGSARINTLMNFLRDENVLYPGMKIVDVGCGNGSITLELAAAGGEVYALDPSSKMLELLQKKSAELEQTNIHPVKARWQEIDLAREGWEEYFDLAFASMSPGVNNGPTLRKLIASSKKHCYFSTFAGRRDKTRSEIWELVTAKPFITADLDIIYPLNLLYSWGYRPNLRFHRHYRCDQLSPDEAVTELYQFVQAAAGAGTEAKNVIEQYVRERLADNLFSYEVEIYQGMLIWDKTLRLLD